MHTRSSTFPLIPHKKNPGARNLCLLFVQSYPLLAIIVLVPSIVHHWFPIQQAPYKAGNQGITLGTVLRADCTSHHGLQAIVVTVLQLSGLCCCVDGGETDRWWKNRGHTAGHRCDGISINGDSLCSIGFHRTRIRLERPTSGMLCWLRLQCIYRLSGRLVVVGSLPRRLVVVGLQVGREVVHLAHTSLVNVDISGEIMA